MRLQNINRGIGVVLLLVGVTGCASGPVNCDRRLEPINLPAAASPEPKKATPLEFGEGAP